MSKLLIEECGLRDLQQPDTQVFPTLGLPSPPCRNFWENPPEIRLLGRVISPEIRAFWAKIHAWLWHSMSHPGCSPHSRPLSLSRPPSESALTLHKKKQRKNYSALCCLSWVSIDSHISYIQNIFTPPKHPLVSRRYISDPIKFTLWKVIPVLEVLRLEKVV